MAKENKGPKQKTLTAEDMKIIESDASLADYIATTKVKEARKTAIIVVLVAVAISFVFGLYTGTNLTSDAINSSSVKVEVVVPEAEAPSKE